MFSDVLPTDDEEDEDDIEAQEASIQRLKVRYMIRLLRHTPFIADLGSGRCYASNDERRVPALFRLPASVFHVPQGFVQYSYYYYA